MLKIYIAESHAAILISIKSTPWNNLCICSHTAKHQASSTNTDWKRRHIVQFFTLTTPYAKSEITVRCRFNAFNFLPNPHKIHVRGTKSSLCSASVTDILCTISCYIGSRYSGTRLHINIYTYIDNGLITNGLEAIWSQCVLLLAWQLKGYKLYERIDVLYVLHLFS